MKTQALMVKTTKNEINLLKDIYLFLNKEAEKRNKSISWFQYAKRSKNTYHFLKNKPEQWELLAKFATILKKKYKKFTTGKIIDIISELVNNSVNDFVITHNYKLKQNLSTRETHYANTLIIKLIANSQFVPDFFWFMPLEKNSTHSWMVKDVLSGKKSMVKRTVKGKFIYYSVYNELK